MSFRMPAEWEAREGTWLTWPHHTDDWPGKFETVAWVFTEIVRILAAGERVEISCKDESACAVAQECLELSHVEPNYRLHVFPTDRGWMRDCAPTAVYDQSGVLSWVRWDFNAWAKYDNYHLDRKIPELVEKVTGKKLIDALRPDNGKPLVLEGGAIETDGAGTMLVTEECLQSEIQCRNPGLTKSDYEKVFAQYLGIKKTIWLGRGCDGDDTHGHIDDIARFVAPGVILLAVEEDRRDENYEPSHENLKRLESETDASGNKLRIVKLPMPAKILFDGQRLPASYANFYIGSKSVIVPLFNDPNDRLALNVIAEQFPNREVTGIYCRDLVLGLGTLHCLTQQIPR
jgi:agmatine deiminase